MVNPLARVVMSNVVNKTNHTKDYNSEKKVGNLTEREKDLLKGIMNRDKQVKNYTNKATMISLDEAVERVRESR